MCRNIKTLHNFEPPATQEEVRASALQYVRKLTGLKSFSKANKAACEHAVDHITAITLDLFDRLVVHGPPRTREVERQKAIERGKKREQQLRERGLRQIGSPCRSSLPLLRRYALLSVEIGVTRSPRVRRSVSKGISR